MKLQSACLVALLLAGAGTAQLLGGSPPSPSPSSTSSQSLTSSQTAASTSSQSPSQSQSSSSSSASTTSATQSEASTTSQKTASSPEATTSAPNTAVPTSPGPSGILPTVTVTSSSSSAVSSSSPPSVPPSSSSSLSTGSIIGISVAGGIAVIGIVAFIVWKLTRKRFSDFDDNEAIKWPELNSHGNADSHPLPVHSTGRAGFETGSEASLSRVNSSNYSTPDFANGAGTDPYAVPPLPHLNPSQPYRDDPSGPTGYYDPYRGPVPGTLENGGSDWSGEAIPMTQMNAGMRMKSPAPPANFGYDGGRQSPVPHLPYQGRASPGPQVAYTGRTSPGPQAAYGGANYGSR